MIKSINGQDVHYIDGIPTIITSIKKNIAKGFILQEDMTLDPCYVAKVGCNYAHAKNIKEALSQAFEKSLVNQDIESKITEFVKYFEKDKLYTIEEFSRWHYILTGSCELGRNNFIKNIEKRNYTVTEFFDKVKNSYGNSIIEELINHYNDR